MFHRDFHPDLFTSSTANRQPHKIQHRVGNRVWETENDGKNGSDAQWYDHGHGRLLYLLPLSQTQPSSFPIAKESGVDYGEEVDNIQ